MRGLRGSLGRLCLLGLPCLLLGACTLPEERLRTDRYEVSARQTEFYKEGPAQAFGPDLALERGRQVTMVKREFGFSQVRLEDNTSGYVATEDLRAILPPPAPKKLRPSRSGDGRSKPRSSNVQPVPGDPLFDITDIPIPLPQP